MPKRLFEILLICLLVCPRCGAQMSTDAVKLNNEGVAAIEKRHWQVAFGKLEAALKLEPQYNSARENLAVAHSNYAFELRRTNKQEALKQFHLAQYLTQGSAFQTTNVNAMIRLVGRNPNLFTDRLVLAESAKSNDDLYGAVMEYQAALKLTNDSQTHKRLGDVYILLNEKDKAGCEYAAASKDKK